MRFLLTAEPFGAAEALRIGLVQEVATPEALLERAIAIGERHRGAGSARRARHAGERAPRASARDEARPRALRRAEITKLMASDDAREGLQSFLERRAGRFTGR